jgi:phasin
MATAPKGRTTKSAAAAKAAAEKTINATAEAAKKATDAAFTYPKFEVPEMVRSFAEEGLKQSREAYARVKDAAEEATDMLEDSLETNRKNVREAQFKALDVAKANADASFDLMRKMLTATSVSDVMQLQSAFARERFDAMVAYSKEMQEMMSKAGAEASEPAKAMFEKAMSFSKAA